MVFGRTREKIDEGKEMPRPQIALFDPRPGVNQHTLIEAAQKAFPGKTITVAQSAPEAQATEAVISVFDPLQHSAIASVIAAQRMSDAGLPVMITVCPPESFTAFGAWLLRTAADEKLSGTRLIVGDDLTAALPEAAKKASPITDPVVIRMPTAPEIQNSGYKYFFSFSDELRRVVSLIDELATNGVTRIYLLGGPGAGKTSLAYYYWVKRAKGNFVTINLSAESTGDKAAMKSLLCGHVAGSIAGAAAREGALSFAQEGVCFLDESHGVTGTVMQVLMEVLDSGQYLPFGATGKRALTCAVLFASNRSWEVLREQINLDEHARLGATIVTIPDLNVRGEDLAVVLAVTLGGFEARCKTWVPPQGLTKEAWQLVQGCAWRGNNRALIRVIEAAAIEHCSKGISGSLIDVKPIRKAMELWEPEEHHSHKIFATYGNESNS